VKQGTPEWVAARLGHITSSRFGIIKFGSGGRMTGTAESYLYELIGEHMTGQPADVASSKSMDWGNKHENEARQYYVLSTGKDVAEKGFHKHPTEEWIGCSPDGGLIEDDGLVEIKCPSTSKEHIRNMATGKVPTQYRDQVNGQLWVTGRTWCDFVSYDPRMRDKKMHVIRVLRDEEAIDELEDRILRFRDKMLAQLAKVSK